MATPKQFEFTAEDLENGGSYAALEPGWYPATLTAVEDYSGGKGPGWKWSFNVEGLDFKTWTSHSTSARWKLIEVTSAFDPSVRTEGIAHVDPNLFIGMTVKARVDYQEDPATHNPDEGPNYKELKSILPDIELTSTSLRPEQEESAASEEVLTLPPDQPLSVVEAAEPQEEELSEL